MKTMKMPSGYIAIEQTERYDLSGGYRFFSEPILAVSKFIFPEKKIAGESRSGYFPTFILVPEAVFLDYVALRVSRFLQAFWTESACERCGDASVGCKM